VNKRAKIVELPPRYATKLDPSRPAAQQISDNLKKAIMEMSLTPGQIISEAEVGHLFGASRTPVRESFTSLRDQGLIVTYPSRGSFVSKLSISHIKSAQFIRESLEISVAEYHCENGLSDDTIDEIADNLSKQKALIRDGFTSSFHELDDNFHAALADSVAHNSISRIVQREKAVLDRLRMLSLHSPEHINTLVKDHWEIFETIRKRDAASARKAVRTHIRRVLGTLADMVDRHDEYFED
jgi:DNA-binding GntR family transcriptional regulator